MEPFARARGGGDGAVGPQPGGGDGRGDDDAGAEAARWKEKYEELLRATTAGARQARTLRARVWETIRD